MPTTILQTKLYTPPPRPDLVLRPHLIDTLNAGRHRKLTLISASAGFGKTTLVSEWIARCDRPVAWLSLDNGDSDPNRFLTYLVAALQTIPIAEGIGARVLSLLQSPQPLPLESLLTALANEITTIPDNFVLVLDDYHVIDAKPVDHALTFLLDHLPPQMHLVITTREDPNLPLARYRARGQLTELRATDLRFTSVEAATFLNQAMGLTLTEEEIAVLENRTEGWVAGLQLAALSIQGRAGAGGYDIGRFIQAFTGSHRFVLDYLVEEVLQRQPERLRSFLLQTAILDRLSGPLCDAVTGQEDGRGMLAALERGNLFVVPLDDERQWYRYHHLFAEVLQARAMEVQPDQIPALHQRASEWYEQHALPADAIHHALAADDFERAADLIELAWPTTRQNYQEATLLGWVKALPDELVRARPILNMYYAFALLSGEPDAGEARLRDIEQWLDTLDDISGGDTSGGDISGAEVEELRSLPGMIAVARAYQAGARSNIPDTVKYARRALDLLPKSDYLGRGSAAVLLGFACWTSGNIEAAQRAIADGLANMRMTGNISAAISAAYILADIRMAQGRLRDAASTGQQALQLATSSTHTANADMTKSRTNIAGSFITTRDVPVLQGTADVYVLLSELHCEQGDLKAAKQYLLTSKELGEHAALQVARHRWYIAMARINEVQGDWASALALLDEAERVQIGNPAPDIHPIAALRARVWVRQGRLAEALGWLQERGLSIDDEPNYLHEFEHITLVRVLIAQYKHKQVNRSIHQAAELLARLLKAAEAGARPRSMIEILVLQALAHHAQGDIRAALISLEEALTLAEPEGYVRLFVDEGAPMAHLLHEAVSRTIRPDYAQQLLAACSPVGSVQIGRSIPQPKAEGIRQAPQSALIEPLSEREVEVLQQIAKGFTNQEVADRLYLTLNTVKVHSRNIYGKLGVHNRTQAVAKARALDILPAI